MANETAVADPKFGQRKGYRFFLWGGGGFADTGDKVNSGFHKHTTLAIIPMLA